MNLEKTLAQIDAEAEKKRGFAKLQSEFYNLLETNASITAPQVICPSPKKWHILVPTNYEEGKMVYTPDHLIQLRSEVIQANNRLDEYIQRHIAEVKNFVKERPDIAVPGCWKPVSVSWRTFVLPSFMNDPVLGKSVYFPCEGHLKLPHGVSIYFEMLDTGHGIKSFYCFNSWGGETTPVFANIQREIRDLNPLGYRFVVKKHREGYFEGVIKDE